MVTLVANVLVVSFGAPWGMGHFVLEVKRVILDPATRGLVRRLDWWPDRSRWQPRLAPGGSFFKNNQKQKPVPEDRLEIHTRLFALRHCDTIVSLLRERT